MRRKKVKIMEYENEVICIALLELRRKLLNEQKDIIIIDEIINKFDRNN